MRRASNRSRRYALPFAASSLRTTTHFVPFARRTEDRFADTFYTAVGFVVLSISKGNCVDSKQKAGVNPSAQNKVKGACPVAARPFFLSYHSNTESKEHAQQCLDDQWKGARGRHGKPRMRQGTEADKLTT
jgi:hypothetical protein